MTLNVLSKVYLVCLFITFVSSAPVLEDATEVTTTPPSATIEASLESRIKNVTLKLDSLNKQVIESLAEQVVRDATEIPVNVNNNDPTDKNSGSVELTYRESGEESTEPPVIKQPQESSTSTSTLTSTSTSTSPPVPVTAAGSEAQEQEKKFSSVLREIKDLEDTIQVAIRNFTSTRQFAYGAMLRPMLSNIQQLRTNLTMLRNRMIGFVALTEIRTQVNHLTDEIGDAIVSVTEKPVLMNHITDAEDALSTEDVVKPLQDSLAWASE